MEYHIALITDDKYVLPTAVCVKSIYESHKSMLKCESLVIHICTFGLEDKNISIFKSLENVNFLIEIDTFNLHDYKHYIEQINQKSHVTPTALIKFDLHNFFKDLNLLLYIDGDIIIKKNLFALFKTDLSNSYLAASYEFWKYIESERYKFGIWGKEFYFNSGVMLLNLQKLREDGITEKLWDYKINKAKTTLMDQESLNAVCGIQTVHLPIKWNFNPAFFDPKFFKSIQDIYGVKYDSIKDLYEDICVIHYVGTYDKPWKYKNARMAEEWLKTYKKIKEIGVIKLRDIPNDKNLLKHTVERIKAFGIFSFVSFFIYIIRTKYSNK